MLKKIAYQFNQSLIFFFRCLLRLYQLLISPLLGNCCRFYPSCSQYTLQALNKFGWSGLWLGFRRLLKCQPWHQGGVDPVPDTLNKKR
jgi:uncharacterized protein